MQHPARVLAASVALIMITAGLPALARTQTVRITDLAFVPDAIDVAPGDVVEWVNDDFIDHTATDKGEAFDVQIAPGAKASVTMKTAGRYVYYCRYHPTMTGAIEARK